MELNKSVDVSVELDVLVTMYLRKLGINWLIPAGGLHSLLSSAPFHGTTHTNGQIKSGAPQRRQVRYVTNKQLACATGHTLQVGIIVVY